MQKALVIAARLPIMRPYQHGGTRQPDEPASLEVGPKEKRKQSLDFRSEKRNMRLLNATSVTLFNNLNQAICVGTHSIEHQKQFLISMSDEVTKATFSCSS
ncbi:hypothetical protein [Aeromonas hydrophila]|uniref:hypothetical protein n=1 Tax=Aeromonas hydrophila TaxID=644 RepID=UPI000676AB5F|nr:hypothetical protein [Aeromonas hydrophila]